MCQTMDRIGVATRQEEEVMRISRAKSDTAFAFVCLVASNWPPGHPRSDHHVSNPHRPDYYCIQTGREDPQCS